jgi:NADPH:quinone reductase-like Zn-dependent oxidoreductase
MNGQWVYKAHDPNSPSELQYQETEKPKLRSANEVRVRIGAVSLNYRDVQSLEWECAEGKSSSAFESLEEEDESETR